MTVLAANSRRVNHVRRPIAFIRRVACTRTRDFQALMRGIAASVRTRARIVDRLAIARRGSFDV